jgi:hypothetical protein
LHVLGSFRIDISDRKISDNGVARAEIILVDKIGGYPSGPQVYFGLIFLAALKMAPELKSMSVSVTFSSTLLSNFGNFPLSSVLTGPKKLV